MKKTKLIEKILFAVVLVATILCSMVAVSADDLGTCGDNLTWTLDDEGTLTISGTGAMYDWSYSSVPWYSYRSSIKTVIIKSGVTSIGNYAFYYCRSLTSVTIGNSVTSIGYQAFYYCRSLTSVTIGDSVTYIGVDAFYHCDSLTSVDIPDSVTSIGDSAFYYCKSLMSIIVDTNNTHYSSDTNGVLFNKDKTELIQYPAGNKNTSYTIPDSVISIGGSAFSYCSSLISVNIPDSVTSIGDWAFYLCTSLSSVNITDLAAWSKISFACAYSNPLYYAHNLYINGTLATNITIPDSVTSIGDMAFYKCTSLISVNIPDSVTSIGNYAFYACTSLSSVTIPDSVTSIGNYAFYDCDSLTRVTIPDSVTSIGDEAFYRCDSLASIYYFGTSSQWDSVEKGSNYKPDETTVYTDCAWITYDANGGTGAPDKQFKVSNVDITLSSLKPTRDEYKFIGWSTSANGEAEYMPGDTYSENKYLTLYAVWKAMALLGDVNGDNEVTSEDSVYLARYFAKWSGYTDTTPAVDVADFDNSGIVDTTDSVILSRHLAKWSGYLTLPIEN